MSRVIERYSASFTPSILRGPLAAANRYEASNTDAVGLAGSRQPPSLAGEVLGTFSRSTGEVFAFAAAGFEPTTFGL